MKKGQPAKYKKNGKNLPPPTIEGEWYVVNYETVRYQMRQYWPWWVLTALLIIVAIGQPFN